MRDFRPEGQRKYPQLESEVRETGVTGSGADAAAPNVANLKDSITANLAPMGITSLTFTEPPETTDSRNQIRGQEHAYLHISDGTADGCLCGYTPQRPAPAGAPDCPACVLLDA